jgi:alginate O-acetyltransferase complex protein AlgI
MRRGYRWVAARRNCGDGACRVKPQWPAWAPLLAMPALAAAFAARLPAWLFMWTLAGAIYLGCKWLTWWKSTHGRAPVARSLGYLFLWPGMDASPFLGAGKPIRPPLPSEWLLAAGKTLLGALLLWGVARFVPRGRPMLAGWTGMLGLIFLLHFGAFHLAALLWRRGGIAAEPIMRMPIAARSLGEFWSARWNRGFNDLAYEHVFRPARRAMGAKAATLLAFLASGLVHELAISVPARGGYGLPTLYFVLQGLGALAERSRAGRRAGLRRGIGGRLFALTIAAAPAYWLFPPIFVGRVIITFMEVIKAL